MYVGEYGTYVHIPKCAGMAVKRALTSAYPAGQSVGHTHGYTGDIRNGFATIRHPAWWLRSYWSYRVYFKWVQQTNAPPYWPAIMALLSIGDGLDWPDFVSVICNHAPGVVGRVYGLYRHPQIKFLRLEYDDLIEHLDRRIELDRVHETPNKPVIEPWQWALICDAESEFIDEYGYTDY